MERNESIQYILREKSTRLAGWSDVEEGQMWVRKKLNAEILPSRSPQNASET